MQPAEFEEKEYEAPLYRQLSADSRVWSPGQVLEQHVGFDQALYSRMNIVWAVNGLTNHRPGLALSRYPWFRRAFLPKIASRTAPNFRLNLFIQAKRPEWGKRLPAAIRNLGLSAGCFFKFSIDENQQAVLGRLAARTASKALIVYASAAFHTLNDLYRYTRMGAVPQYSTFPPARVLAGHKSWYYQKPGAEGVAASSPVLITEKPLLAQIQMAIDETREARETEWWQDLSALANDISTVLRDEDLEESRERTLYFEAVRTLRGEGVQALPPWGVSFAEVAIFASSFGLDWYVLGESPTTIQS